MNRTEGCTTFAVDMAARHGYMAIVLWLHERGCTEGCTVSVTANGHLEVVA